MAGESESNNMSINVGGFVDDADPDKRESGTVLPDNPDDKGEGGQGGDDKNKLVDIPADDAIVSDVITELYGDDAKDVKFNAAGDVVNLEGKILLSKADFDAKKGETVEANTTKATDYISKLETITVDEQECTIKDGAAVDKNGDVVLSKEDLLKNILESGDYSDGAADETDDVFEEVERITGLELVDDDGNKVEFEFTPDGIAQRDLHIARQEGTRIANETINNFFTTNPELEDAYYYLKTNGNLQGFGNKTNHEGITIDKDNETQQYNLVVEAQKLRGYTQEQAEARAKLFKDNDLLYTQSQEELTFIVGKEKADKQATADTYARQQTELAEKQAKYWNDVKTVIDGGKVLDYNIPENIRVAQKNGIVKYYTKDDFYNYMSREVKDGLTQAQLDAQAEDIETKIFNNFLRFTGNNTSYLVDQKVKQNKVNDLKSRFNNKRTGKLNKSVKIKTKRNADNSNIIV